MASVDELVRRLKELEGLQLDSVDKELAYFENDDADGKVYDVQCMAEDVLITDEGQCNWGNIELVKTAGFNVTPCEQDRFGWLNAYIHTTKGLIVFG